GLCPTLLFLLLRRLPQDLGPKESAPMASETCLWLTGLFAFGSVFYFSAVLGQVWFTAHVVSLVLCGIYLLCALPPRYPVIAGLCMGGLFNTRPQMVALGLIFVLELLAQQNPESPDAGRYPLSLPRLRGLSWRRLFVPLILFMVPALLLVAAGCAYNSL